MIINPFRDIRTRDLCVQNDCSELLVHWACKARVSAFYYDDFVSDRSMQKTRELSRFWFRPVISMRQKIAEFSG